MFRREVSIRNLVPGETYCNKKEEEWFRGVFSEYWTNTINYPMLRFYNSCYHASTFSSYTGPREDNIIGSYWRIFDRDEQQTFKYYNDGRFTSAQKKELLTRYVLRERRQYERGLTGSTNLGTWLPRNIVCKIRKYIV